jgi:GT2 family glycosyltransferase
MATVDVLIPSYGRPAALAVTLSSLVGQSYRDSRIVISEQNEDFNLESLPEVGAVLRVLRSHGHTVEIHKHRPRLGMAEQRHFLLMQATAPYTLYIDDDVILEPDLVQRMLASISAEACGFVGSALHGLSYLADFRPHQQAIELWSGPVVPELILPGDPAWGRHLLHNAANLYHVQQRLCRSRGEQYLYKVAWVGGCVLYDTAKLQAVGGFEFWRELPKDHCGEDVLAQLRVMAHFGGCGLLPSGAYHQELPTTVPDRRINAPEVLPIVVPLYQSGWAERSLRPGAIRELSGERANIRGTK